jgi:CRISPR system Cascade subunit CasD
VGARQWTHVVTTTVPSLTRTLVVRLAGPLQSWGDNSPYTTRGTLAYPTYSGLLGLARAALGSPRDANPADWQWLRDLTMAVRIDEPGRIVRDFHTVNPPPAGSWSSPVGQGRKGSKASGMPHIVPVGNGKAWSVGKTPSTLITERFYVADAAFVWLVEGTEGCIRQLAEALLRPTWQLSLGRKACTPEWPLMLGTSPAGILEIAARLPVTTPPVDVRSRSRQPQDASANATPVREVDLHLLHGPAVGDKGASMVCADDPVGSHPHAGHTPRVRSIIRIAAPAATRPALLAWSEANLERP